MVGMTTYGKRQWEHLDSEMRRLIPYFHDAKEKLMCVVDKDTDAFHSYMVIIKTKFEDFSVKSLMEYLCIF